MAGITLPNSGDYRRAWILALVMVPRWDAVLGDQFVHERQRALVTDSPPLLARMLTGQMTVLRIG